MWILRTNRHWISSSCVPKSTVELVRFFPILVHYLPNSKWSTCVISDWTMLRKKGGFWICKMTRFFPILESWRKEGSGYAKWLPKYRILDTKSSMKVVVYDWTMLKASVQLCVFWNDGNKWHTLPIWYSLSQKWIWVVTMAVWVSKADWQTKRPPCRWFPAVIEKADMRQFVLCALPLWDGRGWHAALHPMWTPPLWSIWSAITAFWWQTGRDLTRYDTTCRVKPKHVMKVWMFNLPVAFPAS